MTININGDEVAGCEVCGMRAYIDPDPNCPEHGHMGTVAGLLERVGDQE